jgi:ribonucleotide monophosphatase NagD (HAD superfamily)
MAAILLDIDGVLHVSGEPVPGAGEAVGALRADGHRLRFVTNNTVRAREQLAAELRGIGVEVQAAEITTTPLAAALAELGAVAAEAVMVGDDVDADIGGAKAVGMRAVLVRTGKFREETLAAAAVQPDTVLDSIAGLPAHLREAA